MPIHILPPEVASQIAAGEVIERPASVVKELLENSLDSGATNISIAILDGGRRVIEVGDNGCGISSGELPLAVERHATSKLTSAEDLTQVSTLGFRGEALSAIGSVSRMTISSRTKKQELGALIRVDGGVLSSLEPLGAPQGTLIKVEDLFYNVPARLKFLKSDTTERRLIDKLTAKYAFAYPNVTFKLHHNKRLAIQTSGNNNHREVLSTLFGVDIAQNMLEVNSKQNWLHVWGYISPSSITRASRREIFFFVNGRPIQDKALSAAIIKAYYTFLMSGRYPIAAIMLEMPPEKVDVNVHPTKAEVRFAEPNQIFTGVQSAIRRAILAHNPVPSIPYQPGWRLHSSLGSLQQKIDPAWLWGDESINGISQIGKEPQRKPEDNRKHLDPVQEDLPNDHIPLLRPIGQIALAYLVAEGPDGLYLIDQHAAHERVLFEQFMKLYEENIPSQTLLQPVVVDFPLDQAQLLEEQLTILSGFGFEIESFGKNSFLIRAIPSILINVDPAEALSVVVEDFEEDEKPLKSQIESRLIARICKRAAVKSGKSLSPEEQRSLLLELERCKSPRTCPHGRPTMIHLSVDLLERQFGRKGAR